MRVLPVLGDVAQRQPEQLAGSLIAREMPLVADRLEHRGFENTGALRFSMASRQAS